MTATLQLRPVCSACGSFQHSTKLLDWLAHPNTTACDQCGCRFGDFKQNPDVVSCTCCGKEFIASEYQGYRYAAMEAVFCTKRCRTKWNKRSAA